MSIYRILSPILFQEQILKKTFHENLGENDYQPVITDMISDFSLNPARYSSELHSILLTSGFCSHPLDILKNYYSHYDNYGYIFNSFPDYYILQIFSNTYECNLIIVNKFNQKIWIKPFQKNPVSSFYLNEELHPNNCFWIYYIDGCFLNRSDVNLSNRNLFEIK